MENVAKDKNVLQEEKNVAQEVKNVRSRSSWVDTAKAFGIFLVFLGHLWYSSTFPLLNQMIYSFHVLAFFILSGYVIKSREQKGGFLKFLRKKVLRLLLPAFVCIVVTLPLYFFKNSGINAVDAVKRIFFFEGLVAWNDPVWFLIVMFEAVVVERLLKIKDQNIYIKILYFVVFLVGGFLVYNFDIFLPFGFRKLLICLAFVVLGMMLRELVDVLKRNIKIMHILLAVTFIVSLGLWYLFGVKLNAKTSIYYFNLGNYWYYCLSSLFGSIWFFILCYGIASFTKIFEIVGKSTVCILGTHYLFTRWLRYIANKLKFAFTWKYNVIAVFYTIIIIALYLLVVWLIKRIIKLIKKKGVKKETL